LDKQKNKYNSLYKEHEDLKLKYSKLQKENDLLLSNENIGDIIKDYPVKLKEEKDELLEKVNKLELRNKELQDDIDKQNSKLLKDDSDTLKYEIEVIKKKQEVLRNKYENEIENLNKLLSSPDSDDSTK
jgi:hypothetical protein